MAIFTLTDDLMLLVKIRNECARYEKRHNVLPTMNRKKGFSYKNLERISGKTKPTIQKFLEKCKELNLIVEIKDEFLYSRTQRIHYFDSDQLDEFLEEHLPEIITWRKEFI